MDSGIIAGLYSGNMRVILGCKLWPRKTLRNSSSGNVRGEFTIFRYVDLGIRFALVARLCAHSGV